MLCTLGGRAFGRTVTLIRAKSIVYTMVTNLFSIYSCNTAHTRTTRCVPVHEYFSHPRRTSEGKITKGHRAQVKVGARAWSSASSQDDGRCCQMLVVACSAIAERRIPSVHICKIPRFSLVSLPRKLVGLFRVYSRGKMR